MAGSDLSYWDYVKAAFNLKWRLPLLGNMPANKLLLAGFGILSVGNPGFLLLGLAYETAYLLLMSGNARFQNIVKGEHLSNLTREQSNQEQDLLQRLDPASRRRYDALLQKCRAAIRQEADSQGMGNFAGLKAEGINHLLMIYLKLLNLKSRITQSVSNTWREELENDIKELTTKLSHEPEGSPVARALQGTLEIQKARLENYNNNIQRIKFSEAELDRIEKQVSLITEEVTVGKGAEQWSRILDDVVQSIKGTSQWMADNSEILESVDMPSVPVNLIHAPSTVQQPTKAPQEKPKAKN